MRRHSSRWQWIPVFSSWVAVLIHARTCWLQKKLLLLDGWDSSCKIITKYSDSSCLDLLLLVQIFGVAASCLLHFQMLVGLAHSLRLCKLNHLAWVGLRVTRSVRLYLLLDYLLLILTIVLAVILGSVFSASRAGHYDNLRSLHRCHILALIFLSLLHLSVLSLISRVDPCFSANASQIYYSFYFDAL